MSGGSWNYAHEGVSDIALRLRGETCPLRRALGVKLEQMAKAFHDIEWVDSSDYGRGDDHEAIKAALGKDAPAMVATAAVEGIQAAIQAGRDAINIIESMSRAAP